MSIRVHPEKVIIKDYAYDKDYYETIIVQNTAKEAINIAIVEPENGGKTGFSLVSSNTSIYDNEAIDKVKNNSNKNSKTKSPKKVTKIMDRQESKKLKKKRTRKWRKRYWNYVTGCGT